MSDLLNDFLVSSPMIHFSDSFYSLVKKMDPERRGSSNPTGVTDRSLTPGLTGSGGKRNQTNGQVENTRPSGRIFSYLLDIQVHIVCIPFYLTLLFLSLSPPLFLFHSFLYFLSRSLSLTVPIWKKRSSSHTRISHQHTRLFSLDAAFWLLSSSFFLSIVTQDSLFTWTMFVSLLLFSAFLSHSA